MMKKNKQWVEYHLPCPNCGSSDALSVDSEGDAYCFSCTKFFKGHNKEIELTDTKKNVLEEFDYYPHRGLWRETLEYFDILTKFSDGEPVETAFTWPSGGRRIRRMGNVSKKDRFYAVGDMHNPGLLYKDKFDPGSKDSIIITKSGYDAASAYQILNGKVAVVSVASESTAKKDVLKDWDYVNSFKKVYLCFDNDEQGKKATADVAPLFDYNRVYHIQVTTVKDINELLTAGKAEDFKKIYENARRFAPDNIISSFDQIKNSLKKNTDSQIAEYPFRVLNERTYGIHEGEVILIKARRGVGKSELLRAIEHFNLKNSTVNFGLMHLEEDNGTTVKAIAGYELKVPATLPDCGLSDEDIFNGFFAAVGGSDERVHLYTSFNREDENGLYNSIRFLAGVGCKIIVMDNLTWLVSAIEDAGKVSFIDRLTSNLKALAKELGIAIIEVAHLNAAGSARGAGSIEFFCDTIILAERDEKSASDIVQRTSNFMLEKVRLGGRTGPAGRALFDRNTGRLEDFTDDEGLVMDYSKMQAEIESGELEI